MAGMFTNNPGHLGSFDYVGWHRYSLTFCTDRRTSVFVSRDAFDLVLSQFLRAADDERMAIPAYCFMPDHVHLLAEGQHETSDCRGFIKRAKQFSGYYYKQRFGCRLWQRYGWERVLRDDEATMTVARYIFDNPLRKGLVSRAIDYPYLSSTVFPMAEILEAIQDGVVWSA